MFEKFFDLIIGALNHINPFVVVNEYDGAIRIRLGIVKGELKPGLHFKWPFIDNISETQILTTTMSLSEQSITTKDWKSVVCRAVIKYKINNVTILLTKVNDATDAVSDMAKGIIRTEITKRNWENCNDETLPKEVKSKVKKEAEKWGIEVIDVTFTDLSETPSFRLFNSNSTFQQT